MKNLKKLQNRQPDFDQQEWDEFTKDIKPIPHPDISDSTKPLIIDLDISPVVNIHTIPDSQSDLHPGNTTNIDKRTAQKFNREEFKIEAILDLHGQTEKNAFDKVSKFITSAYANGKRCILIITGKGLPHDDEDIFAARGILKNCVPNWLNSPELRPMILAYKNPSESRGGSGALYILLRRHR